MNHESIIHRLVEVAPPILRERYSTDCCIAATRVAIDVLDYFAIKVRPLAVTALVFNAAAVQLVEAGKPYREHREAWDETGAWAVGIGAAWDETDEPGKWNGHLVAVTDDKLIDLSLDQASRPQRGMVVKPVALDIPPEDLARLKGGAVVAFTDRETGLRLAYTIRHDPGWRSSPDWRLTRHKPLVGKIIRAMKEGVAA